MAEPKVIFEDEQLLVLDKPSGWVVNEAETTKHQDVIQVWLRNMAYPLAKNAEMRSGIVHRLDKETSGVLVVAKTKDVFENLQSQFKERVVRKKYTALVHGKIEPKEGVVGAPVGRLPWNRERFGVLPGGRKAITNYKVLEYYSLSTDHRSPLTLVEFYPETGRTHQIRIHAKYLGYPIVSDQFYAGRKTARDDRTWCPRLFLHASEISFSHPKTGRNVSFKSKLTLDLSSCLKRLQE
ncbi:MAG: RluA family pseudouridine synthase [Patescibacteria group bacterium]